LEQAKKLVGDLPPSWSEQKNLLETLLQVGGSKKTHWKPSSKLEGAKKTFWKPSSKFEDIVDQAFNKNGVLVIFIKKCSCENYFNRFTYIRNIK
jgi:hypothetical protein